MSQQPNPSTTQPQRDRIKGVFSTQEIRKVGTGTTQRKTVYKGFYFVEEDENGTIECQPLNANYVPSGQKRNISLEEVIEKFSPEPEFYLNSVYPKMRELQRTLDNADAHRAKGETFAAELEYSTALKVDEENVRANFGIGLTYLQRGENNKADDIFERLVKLDAAFDTEHKNMFNDFGINLRKAKMYRQAIIYYSRALELTREDENLHVNLARALFEAKDIDGCVEHLLKALALSPMQEQATKFLLWLVEKQLVTERIVEEKRRALARDAGPDAESPEGQAPADAS
jgi:tetratricopeptide (TPR) repeat protein